MKPEISTRRLRRGGGCYSGLRRVPLSSHLRDIIDAKLDNWKVVHHNHSLYEKYYNTSHI